VETEERTAVDFDEQRAELHRERDGLDEQRQRINNIYRAGQSTKERWHEDLAALDSEQTALMLRLADVAAQEANASDDEVDVRAEFRAGGPLHRRRVVERAIERIKVLPGNGNAHQISEHRLIITWRPGFEVPREVLHELAERLGQRRLESARQSWNTTQATP